MSEKPFFFKSENDLNALEKWCKERKYDSLSISIKDKNGNPMIGLGKDRNPDSEWSKTDPCGLVIILNHALYDSAYQLIRRVGGFKTVGDK